MSLILSLVMATAAPAAPVPASPDKAAFAALSARYVDLLAKLDPNHATLLGDHRFDATLTDVSTRGRWNAVLLDHKVLADLAKIDRSKLDREAQVDAALLENQARYDLWRLTVEKDWLWDIQIYNESAGNALYGLAARDFAPWPVRMRAATARMAAMPAFLAQARAAIDPARVPEIYATTVAKQNGGIVEIAEGMLAPHRDVLNPKERAAFDAALAGLKTAVAVHQKWLDTVLVPQAKGDFRLGTKLYDEKMRFALVSDMSRATIKARATAALADTRAQMYAIARAMFAGTEGGTSLPPDPTPAQQQKAIEAALELTYAKRPARADLMQSAERTLASATDFVRAKNLVTLPAGPVRIITMPVFQQGVAVAYCDSPGPLETQLPTFYAISPIPKDWDDAKATSFLREYNDYMIHDLSIHEAMPGHYLQIAHANGNQSVLRAVLSSGPFVEGWAVYAEGMMADADYLGEDARAGQMFKLTVLKMRLRSITNSLLDIGIQTEGLTREAAMTMMTQGAFQQEREAAGKWVRASLGSTQLLSYFTGYAEHMDMRAEARRRLGAKFDLKTYNDAVISHGSPPARFVRELMFDLPIG